MFGLNNAQLIGRLGADATISHLTNGGRVANVSIATDESYLDKNSGDKVDRTEWHRIVTFQDGLVEMMEKHAKKGRLVYVSGIRRFCCVIGCRLSFRCRIRRCFGLHVGCVSQITRSFPSLEGREILYCRLCGIRRHLGRFHRFHRFRRCSHCTCLSLLKRYGFC